METHGLKAAIDFLGRYDSYAVVGHEDPDGDCISSQLVLASHIRREGKHAELYSAGPFHRPEIQRFESSFQSSMPSRRAEKQPSFQAVVIIDCSTLNRIGFPAEAINDLPICVIDHHSAGVPYGNARYVDVEAPASTYLIQRIIESTVGRIETADAELLLFGLCTDTGFFRHLEENSEDVFTAAARLIAAGASPKRAYAMIYHDRPFTSRKHLGKMLNRTEAVLGGKVLVTFELLEDRGGEQSAFRDSDSLYQQLQGVEGCEAVVFIREESAEECSVGLRSNNFVDVGEIAKRLGGGGHRKASGYNRMGRMATVKREALEYLAKSLNCK